MIDPERVITEHVVGDDMPDVAAELTVRRDQTRQLWKDAWEARELSSARATVDAARVVNDRLDNGAEEVTDALGGSREHDDASF